MTPAPPPAAPLTAEEIAASEESDAPGVEIVHGKARVTLAQIDKEVSADRKEIARLADRSILWLLGLLQIEREDADTLRAENAALRDRLARQEAREREARGHLSRVLYHIGDGDFIRRNMPDVAAAWDFIAAPTDGAARAGDAAEGAQWVDRGGGWMVKEPPSDSAMVERIRALGFAVPFTLTGEARQADRLTREVVERYTIAYGPPADEDQVRRACGLPLRAGDAAGAGDEGETT